MHGYIDISEATEVEISHSYHSDESWTFGDEFSLLVSDRLSESLAKQLVFTWLIIPSEKEPDSFGIDQFWLWLGDAADRQYRLDGGYRIKPQQPERRKPCIGDFF